MGAWLPSFINTMYVQVTQHQWCDSGDQLCLCSVPVTQCCCRWRKVVARGGVTRGNISHSIPDWHRGTVSFQYWVQTCVGCCSACSWERLLDRKECRYHWFFGKGNSWDQPGLLGCLTGEWMLKCSSAEDHGPILH